MPNISDYIHPDFCTHIFASDHTQTAALLHVHAQKYERESGDFPIDVFRNRSMWPDSTPSSNKYKRDPHRHGLRKPNEGINQRNLKIWADVADKTCSCRT